MKFWYFNFANPVVRRGEKGAFKWVFRRFWLEIRTLSGNFEAKFLADEHPYGYLIAGDGDDNIHGFCAIIYELSKIVTTDQALVDDLKKAIDAYEKRLEMIEVADEDEDIAIAEVREIQEVVEMPKKERKKYERDVNGRFKKAVKAVQKEG